jgi:glycosyltransferase involved in cell wall biosynthesis
MSIKKNILAVVARMPYPFNSGGRIATHDVLLMLSKNYNITLIIIDDNHKNIEYLDFLKNITNDIYFVGLNKYYCLFNAVKYFFTGIPLQVGYFYSKKTQYLINELSKNSDLFLSFVIRTSYYGMNLNIKKYNYAVDSMYLNYKKSINNSRSLFWKLVYKIELPLLYNAELNQIKNFDLTTFVNKDEASYWQNIGNVINLPHGLDNNIFEINSTDHSYSKSIAFIGRMDYQPNIDAVLWFCENVLEYLNPDINFIIIGGFLDIKLKKYFKKFNKIQYFGFVENPNIILRSCICNIATMQTGGGLQTKILLSMGLGCIVISSTSSAMPIINAENLVNLIIEDNPVAISNYINDIYINRSKYEYIKNNARKLIYENYSNSKIKEKLFKHLNEILLK